MISSGDEKKNTYAEGNTYIEIGDEAGGEFVIITQDDESWRGKLAFDRDEWAEVKDAVDEMFTTLIQE